MTMVHFATIFCQVYKKNIQYLTISISVQQRRLETHITRIIIINSEYYLLNVYPLAYMHV
jgi:hypothetical protein